TSSRILVSVSVSVGSAMSGYSLCHKEGGRNTNPAHPPAPEHKDQRSCATRTHWNVALPGSVPVALSTANTGDSVTSFGKSVPAADGMTLESGRSTPSLKKNSVVPSKYIPSFTYVSAASAIASALTVT